MTHALMMRARLLCAVHTFVRPAGPFSEFDALMRWSTHRDRRASLSRLIK